MYGKFLVCVHGKGANIVGPSELSVRAITHNTIVCWAFDVTGELACNWYRPSVNIKAMGGLKLNDNSDHNVECSCNAYKLAGDQTYESEASCINNTLLIAIKKFTDFITLLENFPV